MAERRVFLHIGAPKTGTTYLQHLLVQNRKALADKGILYPDSLGDAHHKAVWDLRGTPQQREGTQGIEGSWQRLVDVVEAADGDVLLSSEHFVFALKPQVRRAVESFTGEVHVIYTARDLVRQVPAVWQERIKNQKTVSYREFVESVMQRSGPGAKAFWGAQDAAGALARWAEEVDPSRIHIVTMPPPGQPPRVIWDRFISVPGLHGSDFDVDSTGLANESLSMTQTELLRRYNVRHAQGIGWQAYRRVMRRQLDVMAAIEDSRKVSLTPTEQAYFAAQAADMTARLLRQGYLVVGDLADLTPTPLEGAPSGPNRLDPTELSDGELLDAALDVIHELLGQQADVNEERRGKRRARRHARRSDEA